jgi:hypothetical protein
MNEHRWPRWEPPGLRRFGYSGRVLIAGILPDIARAGWHWKIMDVLKPPRRERWTLQGKAATGEDARTAVEVKWRQLCEAYGLVPAGEHHAKKAEAG